MKIGTLYGDEGGDGHVKLTPEFQRQSAIYQADVIKDCIFDLLSAYNDARKEMGWAETAIEFVPVDEIAQAQE